MKVIYKATNVVTGKSYIGIDSNWPHRKAAHKHAAIKRGSDLIFHKAIRKYGWEKFEWSILEDLSHVLHEDICNRERHYIQEFDSYGENGYNMTFGGEGSLGWTPSEDTRMKISQANFGKVAWNKGCSSPWTSQRNRENKGIPNPNKRKLYEIVDPNGKVYHVHGLVSFCKEHNLHPGNMSSVAKGKLNHYKQWKCKLLTNVATK